MSKRTTTRTMSRTMWATFTRRGRLVWLFETRREALACCGVVIPTFAKVTVSWPASAATRHSKLVKEA